MSSSTVRCECSSTTDDGHHSELLRVAAAQLELRVDPVAVDLLVPELHIETDGVLLLDTRLQDHARVPERARSRFDKRHDLGTDALPACVGHGVHALDLARRRVVAPDTPARDGIGPASGN